MHPSPQFKTPPLIDCVRQGNSRVIFVPTGYKGGSGDEGAKLSEPGTGGLLLNQVRSLIRYSPNPVSGIEDPAIARFGEIYSSVTAETSS